MSGGTGTPGGRRPDPSRPPRPPPLARFLARRTAGREDRDFVEADLRERFRSLARARGRRAARRWYWWQVLRGLSSALRPEPYRVRDAGRQLRAAFRTLVRRPLYAAGVTGTLAIGLGSAAAVAAVAWTVWLSPMPYHDPDRVVRLYEVVPPGRSHAGVMADADEGGRVRWQLSPPILEDMRAHDWTTLQAVAGVSRDNVDWTHEERTTRLTAVLANPELGGILGLRPVVGGLLGPDPEVAEVVLTPAFWEGAFGGDPAVVGRTLSLDGEAHRVVGVAGLPDGYPPSADILLPLRFGPSELVEGMRGARYLDGVARVRPGRSVSEADAEVDAFFRTLGEAHSIHEGSGGRALTLADDLIRPYTDVLSLLLLAGGIFLALALVNVAGLVAARRVEGRADRWVRLALGATRGRLLHGTLTEGALVGGLAAALGLVAAWALMGPVRALVPPELPRVEALGLPWPVAATILLVGWAGGMLVGLLGHLLTRGSEPGHAGRSGVRGGSAPGLGGRRALVVGQVALTTLLATGGLVILAHVASLQRVELGFRPEGVLGTPVILGEARYPSDEARGAFWSSLVEGLEARGLPSAVAVNPPMAGSTMTFNVRKDAASEQVFAQYHAVSPGYFRILGVEVVDGRAPGPEDGPSDAPVVVLDQTLAATLFPTGGAVGREVTVVSTPRTVVGVVAATRHFGPDVEAPPSMYVPLAQDPWLLGHLLVEGGRGDVAAALTGVAAELDGTLALPPLAPYTRYVEDWYAPLRLQSVVVGILAVVGVLLAALGLYALVAYHVTSRRKEIGIRMALGAPGGGLFGQVVGQGLVLAGAGLALGLGAWYALTPVTRRLLEGVESVEGVGAPVLVVALVGVMAILATLLPAWRSTAVDPVTTLAAE